MFTRISSLAVLALLAGCSESDAADAAGEEARAEAGGIAIACALDGSTEFSEQCWFERVERDGERLLVIHHPDGGFRRLALVDGGGLAAADGADEPAVTLADGVAEVSLAGSRYRLPLRDRDDDTAE